MNNKIIDDLKNKYIIKKKVDTKPHLSRNLQAEINKINAINIMLRSKYVATSELLRLEFSLETLLKTIEITRCLKENNQSS